MESSALVFDLRLRRPDDLVSNIVRMRDVVGGWHVMGGSRSWLTDRTTMPRRPAVAWIVGLLLLVAGSARGQGPNRSSAKFYPDSSDTAEALLRNAASHARDRQWSAAIEIYQRVIDQFGDKVARLPKDDPATDQDGSFVLYVDDRHFCHGAIAHFPPEARAIYRNR